jgi:hypothetical protein
VGVIRRVWPWYEQPQEAALFSARKLPALRFGFIGSGGPIANGGIQGTLFNTAEFVVARAGQALRTYAATNGSRLEFPNVNSFLPNGTTELTLAVFRRFTDTTNRLSSGIGGETNSSQRFMCYVFSDGRIYFDCGNATEGSGRLSVAFGGKTLNPETVVCTLHPVEGRKIWRNSTLLASNTSTFALTNVTSPFCIGARSNSTTVDNEEIYLALLEARAWGQDEVRAFAENPYSVLEDRQIYVPYSAAPSGAPTLTDLQATNITANSVQFTYDYAF